MWTCLLLSHDYIDIGMGGRERRGKNILVFAGVIILKVPLQSHSWQDDDKTVFNSICQYGFLIDFSSVVEVIGQVRKRMDVITF